MEIIKEVAEYRELKNKISNILKVKDARRVHISDDIKTLHLADIIRKDELALIIKQKYLMRLSHAEAHELQFDTN